jgi:AcrR family transcriptional regulator
VNDSSSRPLDSLGVVAADASAIPAGQGKEPVTDDNASISPGTRRQLVESQIMAAATRLFAARGFAGTNLQDIAEATGLTRPALYHYFKSKESLLSRLVADVTESPAEELERILGRDASVRERLHDMAYAVALRQAANPERFRLLVRSEAELPEGLSEIYANGRRQVLKAFATVIEEGVRSGELRPVDARTSALGVIGLCNWVAWWHKPGADDAGVAEALAQMAVASVSAEGGQRAAEGEGAVRALALLKQDIALLERALSE